MSECINYIREQTEKQIKPYKDHNNAEVMAVTTEALNEILKKAEKKYAEK